MDLRTLPEGLELIQLPAPKSTQIKAIQFSQNSSRLFIMTGAGGIQEWDLADLRQSLATVGLDWQPAGLSR